MYRIPVGWVWKDLKQNYGNSALFSVNKKYCERAIAILKALLLGEIPRNAFTMQRLSATATVMRWTQRVIRQNIPWKRDSAKLRSCEAGGDPNSHSHRLGPCGPCHEKWGSWAMTPQMSRVLKADACGGQNYGWGTTGSRHAGKHGWTWREHRGHVLILFDLFGLSLLLQWQSQFP